MRAPLNDHPHTPDPHTPDPSSKSTLISRALTGDLPCAFCDYELRGLSVEGRCPECGILIRATILHTVDPEADELKPITQRHAVSIALVLWAAGGLAAVLGAWAPRIADIIWRIDPARTHAIPDWAPRLQLLGIAASGIAMLILIRPVRLVPLRESALAAFAAILYIPLYITQSSILSAIDPLRSAPYLIEPALARRIELRLLSTACIITILLAFRPTARRLVRRSLALRTGRVGRQTILAMTAALVITAAADGARLLSLSLAPGPASIVEFFAKIAILLGSAMFTLGFVSALIDCWRIRRAIMIPSPSLRQVLGDPPQEDAPSCQAGSPDHR